MIPSGPREARPGFSRWVVRNDQLSEKDSRHVTRTLLESGVVILPTDTIYGLHAVASETEGVSKLFRIKAREEKKPFLVLCNTIDQMCGLGVSLRERHRDFLASIWPAPLTVVLPLAAPIPASAGSLSLAIRIPALEGLRGLIARTGPLASTSVNRSGEPPLQDMRHLIDVPAQVAGIVDAGQIVGRPSTVLDLTSEVPRLLRQGVFVFSQNLWKTLRKRL